MHQHVIVTWHVCVFRCNKICIQILPNLFKLFVVYFVEIYDMIKQGYDLRPNLSLLTCDAFIRTCIKDCWHDNPDHRPDFKNVRIRLKPMLQGMWVLFCSILLFSVIILIALFSNEVHFKNIRRLQFIIPPQKSVSITYQRFKRFIVEIAYNIQINQWI